MLANLTMNFDLFSNITPRVERKYLIDYITIEEILTRIYFNPLGFREEYPPRYIYSLYLDTGQLSCAQAVLDGLAERFKIRWRWYDQALPKSKVQLEIKLRKNLNIYKKIMPVYLHKPLRVEKFIEKQPYFADKFDNELKSTLKLLLPSVFSSYLRYYLIDVKNKIRLTLDTYLRYKNIGHSTASLMQTEPSDSIILELKYHPYENKLAQQTISNLPLRLSKHSKYIQGVFS